MVDLRGMHFEHFEDELLASFLLTRVNVMKLKVQA